MGAGGAGRVGSTRRTPPTPRPPPLVTAQFPFDGQQLLIVMQSNSLASDTGNVTVIPSAAGLALFTLGAGDDVSGWSADNITITANTTPFQAQFHRNNPDAVVARSAPADPAPLVPHADPGAMQVGWAALPGPRPANGRAKQGPPSPPYSTY